MVIHLSARPVLSGGARPNEKKKADTRTSQDRDAPRPGWSGAGHQAVVVVVVVFCMIRVSAGAVQKCL